LRQDHGAGDERAGKRAAPGLIDAGNETESSIA
jgi:hypothetical protein